MLKNHVLVLLRISRGKGYAQFFRTAKAGMRLETKKPLTDCERLM